MFCLEWAELGRWKGWASGWIRVLPGVGKDEGEDEDEDDLRLVDDRDALRLGVKKYAFNAMNCQL